MTEVKVPILPDRPLQFFICRPATDAPPFHGRPGNAVYELRGDFMIDMRKGNLSELRPANAALQPIMAHRNG